MKITCNSARHAISGRNFDESLDQNAAGRLKPVDPNIAALLGHSEEVQARHYVDSWAKSAVKGYRIVKLLAERQKGLFGADIAAAERRVKFMGRNYFFNWTPSHGLDSFAAYKASRIVMCPEMHINMIPFDADNQLDKLLMAAYGDAYHRKRKASVVIVLKPAVGIAAVVLLGEAISPSSPQRYSCCVSYDESAESCYAVRKCPLNTEGPTLSEEFGRAELLHFRTKNHDMWTDLLYKKNLEFSYVINVMRQYHSLQSLCTFRIEIFLYFHDLFVTC
ncbi:hypothetical protein OSTOST_24532 [Ostertagia ostertagi]